MKEQVLKALREPGKAARVLLHRSLAPIGQTDFKRFVVLTRDRTGSNMLIQALNSHPNIAADYEIFAKLHGSSEQDILGRCFARQPFYIRAKGFKIFYYHPQDAPSSPIWDMLTSMEDLHVIHLKRRNILHALVSSRIAYQSGVYGVRSDRELKQYTDSIPTVVYSEEQLEKDFQQTRSWETETEARFESKPMLELHYEDVAADLKSEFRRVTEFLSFDYREPQTDFRKQGTKSMRSLLGNYDELKEHFAGTEWSSFFNE